MGRVRPQQADCASAIGAGDRPRRAGGPVAKNRPVARGDSVPALQESARGRRQIHAPRTHPERSGFFVARPPILKEEPVVSIIWTIIIGFVAGIIAKFLHPGPNEPSGFILTTVLGIVGALVPTYLGQAVGWYQAGEGAGLIGAIVGAVIVLVVWGLVAGRNRATV